MVLTRKELVKIISEKTNCSKATAIDAVEAFIDAISDTIVNGGRVEIRGLCSIDRVERKSKVVQNIHKKECMIMPARIVPKFKPSKSLVDKCN